MTHKKKRIEKKTVLREKKKKRRNETISGMVRILFGPIYSSVDSI